jgi:hypothetical protein
MYHHHITRAIAEAHAADLQRTAARNRSTAPVRSRHRRRVIVAALIAICALAPTAAAIARPTDSVTAGWQSNDQQIAKLTPEEFAAAAAQDARSPAAKYAVRQNQSELSPDRVDAAAHAATIRGIGAALAARDCA